MHFKGYYVDQNSGNFPLLLELWCRRVKGRVIFREKLFKNSRICREVYYLALLVNVWMVDLGPEADLGRLEGVLRWKHQVYQEGSLTIRIIDGIVCILTLL